MKIIKPIVICGPTACGKSALAFQLAQELRKRNWPAQNAVIINADSQQVYKEIPILSNQPGEEEKRLVPHRLFGEISGDENFNVAIWLEKVKSFISTSQTSHFIITGGTGMYLNALLRGLSPIPEIPPEIRQRVREMEKAELVKALGDEADGNTSRMRRALEVRLATGKKIGQFHEVKPLNNNYIILNLNVPRETLYEKINDRFLAMMENGAIDEVKNLRKFNYDSALPVMKAIGVAEIKSYLEGKISKAQAIEKSQQATRNYAKRQMTWFRHQLPSGKIDIANFADAISLF